MSLAQGSNIVKNGLIFHYDSFLNDRWFSKSYKGKPTINYAWNQNAVARSSYTPYTNSGGTWNIKHPNAIRAYNKAGTDITGYVNTGANGGDWTNMYHAVWEYDNVLKKPVVVMRNWDGSQWKAKNWSLGKSYSTMGLGYGDTYTISWLQWTDNIGRTPSVGLYGRNTSGTNGFHDGLSGGTGGGTHASTKAETWQRVYKTYTVSSANNLTAAKNCYMYGHYGGAGVIKIADVQIEVGLPSPFIAETSEATSTRSNTDTLVDLTGNSTITANSLTYNNDGTFEFVNSNLDYISGATPNTVPNLLTYSWDAWVYAAPTQNNPYPRIYEQGYILAHISQTPPYSLAVNTTVTGSATLRQGGYPSFDHSTWTHLHASYDGQYTRCYVNGVKTNENNHGSVASLTASTAGYTLYIGSNGASGSRAFNGKIESFKFYSKVLSDAEVKQNFEAERGRYGI